MKDVRIVTYCTWTSLGSIMQTVGLKKALSELGAHSSLWLHENNDRYREWPLKEAMCALL